MTRIQLANCASLLLVLAGVVLTQSSSPAAAQTPYSAVTYIRYPSLQPVSAIDISTGLFPSDLYDAIEKEKNNPKWNCAVPGFYKVAVVDKTGKILRNLTVEEVVLMGNDPSGARFTKCQGHGLPGEIQLILSSDVDSNDLLKVFIYEDTDQKTQISTSTQTLQFTASSFPAFTITPQAAPAEALNNGETRDVGQLNVTFSDSNLVKRGPLNVYAKSTDLFSTDGKDAKSAMSFTGGIQRGLFPRWYSPWQLQETLQGNQTAKNLSAVTSFRLSADPPWLWTRSFLNNKTILAPLPPEPSIANLYTHRLNQLVTEKTPLLAQDDYSLNPSFSWDTISFPFTCKLLFWERSVALTPPAADQPTPLPTTCLGTEIDLGLWYLPLDLTASKSQRVEGYGDISILIPLTDFAVASKQLTYVTGGSNSTKFQLRIKYADAVNATNNYARTKQWTVGIEALIAAK